MIANPTPQHRTREFRGFLDPIDEQVPDDLPVHVVLDNVATHRTVAIQRWLQRHPCFTFHFTPTSSSWMNLVERWVADWNEHPPPFVWHETAEQILNNLAEYLHRIPDSGH